MGKEHADHFHTYARIHCTSVAYVCGCVHCHTTHLTNRLASQNKTELFH